MKNLFLLLLAIFLASEAKSNGDPIGGARALSLGGASITLSDHWSGFHNQAGLAGVEKFSAGVYLQNNFLLSELSTRGLGIALPAGGGVFGLSVKNYGYSQYQEGSYGLAYARKLSEQLFVGVQFNYLNTKIGEGYGSNSTFTVEGGFQFQASENVMIAGHVYNPNRSKLSEYEDERIPTLLSGGVQYAFSEKTFITGQVVKEVDEDASFRFGVEYKLVEKLILRAGVGTEPTLSAFGLGINLEQFQIDIAAAYHNTLGYIPQLSLSYHAK